MNKQKSEYSEKELRLLLVAVGVGALGSMASNAIFLLVQKTSLITQIIVYLICVMAFLITLGWLITEYNSMEK